VKRYVSEKGQDEHGSWRHHFIELQPLNPEHESWRLDPEREDRYRVIAEFVQVLY
jgi:hypothetical protein